MPEMCTADDCRGLARRLVQVEDIGTFPYCQPCADVMVRTGDEDRGPVDLITDEMVEHGAIGLFLNYKAERPSTYGPNRALSQAERGQAWEGVAIKSWYRRKARAVLTAALMPLDSPNTEETP